MDRWRRGQDDTAAAHTAVLDAPGNRRTRDDEEGSRPLSDLRLGWRAGECSDSKERVGRGQAGLGMPALRHQRQPGRAGAAGDVALGLS